MNKLGNLALLDHLKELPDPRIERSKLHKLIDIMFIAVCATICGADTWEEIADYGRRKETFLKRFLELPHGIPSHDTFNRVFARLNADAWQRCFLNWVAAVVKRTQGEVVALDGKRLRASRARRNDKAALEMVSAWASTNRLVLAQTEVAEDSNEITAVPELLELLELEGCIVTLDALHCQSETAQKISAKGADYLLALKGNQEKLLEDAQWLFRQIEQDAAVIDSYTETFDAAHGRFEIRRCSVISEVSYLHAHAWPALAAVAKVEGEREIDGKLSKSQRYYLASFAADAQTMLAAVRAHWGIENGVHWVLDVAFREDQARTRTGEAPANMAVLRHLTLNLLRQEKTAKAGIKPKRFNAALDDSYLLSIEGVGNGKLVAFALVTDRQAISY